MSENLSYYRVDVRHGIGSRRPWKAIGTHDDYDSAFRHAQEKKHEFRYSYSKRVRIVHVREEEMLSD